MLHLSRLTVSTRMIAYLTWTTQQAVPNIPCSDSHATTQASEPDIPPLSYFIKSIVRRSGVTVPTVFTGLIYLRRLQQYLPLDTDSLPSTPHRVFLAALNLAEKNLHDAARWNKHWSQCSTIPEYNSFGFSNAEVNLMERQFLYLLNWNIRIKSQDFYDQVQSWLTSSYCHRPLNIGPYMRMDYKHFLGKLHCTNRALEPQSASTHNQRRGQSRGTKTSTAKRRAQQ
jgi:G1/S-specific cyclin PLC1